MRIAQALGLLIGALAGDNTFGANFTMVAVGAFGEPLTECRVESFKSTDIRRKHPNDYRGRFRGMVASNVPNGKYNADIRCGETRIGEYVEVSNHDVFKVVSENIRISRSDHVPPHLAIRLISPRPQGEKWWLTLRALYRERSDTVEFQGDTEEAGITDPDPGSYVVSVLSSTGYSCLREVDLVEFTRLWTFDPATCEFQVDAFAHIVTDGDKRALKTTSWYQQLRKSNEELWRALEKAAKAERDSKLGK
jgi:hypothetical protein